jgi:hypothetical protein
MQVTVRRLLTVLLFALLLAGCGGGDDSGGNSGGSAGGSGGSGGSSDGSGGGSGGSGGGSGGSGGGGSGGSSSGGSAEVTKAEFIKKADQVCTDFRDKSAELEQKANKIPRNQLDRLAPVLRELSDAADETFDEFDDLQVPAGDEQTIDRYLAANRSQIDVIEKTADAFESGDLKAATKLISSGQDAGNRTQQIAQDYGFKVCGSGTG